MYFLLTPGSLPSPAEALLLKYMGPSCHLSTVGLYVAISGHHQSGDPAQSTFESPLLESSFL